MLHRRTYGEPDDVKLADVSQEIIRLHRELMAKQNEAKRLLANMGITKDADDTIELMQYVSPATAVKIARY